MAEFITKLGETSTFTNFDLFKPQSAEQALEEIQTPKFFDTLKSFYSYREGKDVFKSMDNADLLEYFYNDRSWRNHNLISMGIDMTQVFGESDTQRLAEFNYIQQTYMALPSWWNDPNRSFGGWLIDNGGAMILDPINLVGVGVGGQAAKQSFRQALKLSLKAKMSKEVNKKTIEEAAKLSTKKALGRAVKKGALTEGYIGTIIGGAHDSILQGTAIRSGVQDEFSLKQAGISSAAGFGFGTVFGGVFAAGSFKLTNRLLKNETVKNLQEFHNYGKSTTTGNKLFEELLPKSLKAKGAKPKLKDRTKEDIEQLDKDSRLHGDTTEKRIKNLRKDILSTDKPPKLKLNITKYEVGGYRKHLKQKVIEISGSMGTDKVTVKEMIERAVALGYDRIKLEKMSRRIATDPVFKEQFAYIIAHADAIAREFQDINKLALELHRVDLSPSERKLILDEINIRDKAVEPLLDIQKQMQENVARGVYAGNVIRVGLRAQSLKVRPEDPKMIKVKSDNPEKYWKAVGLLTDDDQIHLALSNARKVGKWDLAAEYVNNNLLSSPDTHIINIVSGLTQTQWKPFVILLRAANMLPKDRQRAMVLARESFQTYVYQYVYLAHALGRAGKSFYMGRPILDSMQMKWDSNIRQGQLQRWISETAKLGTEPLGLVGKVLQLPFETIGLATTLPLRTLAAGDEFLKTMMFRARMASLINSRILEETPNFSLLKGDSFKTWYKNRWKEIQKEFYDADTGRAIEIGDRVQDQLNSPLHYAREGSYTQKAGQINPVTNKRESQITGWVLKSTNEHRWARVFGLHFINTPSNLLRWNFQHLPFLGRFQFQMRHMLAEVDDLAEKGTFKGFTKKALGAARSADPSQVFLKGRRKKYINPEAAAEANARIQAGWLLWGSAVSMAMAGKFTGGGSRDYKINRERESITGWQPYSYRTEDGRYISLNRLDPIFMPFFIAADMYERTTEYFRYNDNMPEGMRSRELELALGTVATLVRNLTSKFYTKNILETANFLMSDDFLFHRKPEYSAISVFSRAIYKVMPLSGGLRYADRVNDEWEKDLWDFNDRMTRIFLGDESRVMPRRNMLGEKIDRKNGWLFGLGGSTGLWSTPFAMTKWKNATIANFFEGRDFTYRPPPKKGLVDIGVDLRSIRNSKNQTAYDRWLELKQEITFRYKRNDYELKAFIEMMIENKTSPLYRHPKGKKETKWLFFTSQKGYDFQQNQILSWIHQAERQAYFLMIQEFPQIKSSAIENAEQIQQGYQDAETAIQILTQ
jgi:hypothetical protein